MKNLWTQHVMAVALALLAYVLTTRAGTSRRPPSSAVAWVLGLLLVPYVVLPLYFVFGARKLRRGAATLSGPPNRNAHWAAALIEAFGLPEPSATLVRFHADGEHARSALWQIVEGARESLDVCTFLIGNDELGVELIKRLARRASEGVRVRLLVDGAGLWFARRPSCDALLAAGGDVRVFHSLLSLRRFGSRNLRNHRKLIVADRRRLWCGGRNLATNYFGGPHDTSGWIDLSFDMSGAIAMPATTQFERDWNSRSPSASPLATGDWKVPAPQDGIGAAFIMRGSLVQFIPSGPDQAEDTVETLLLAACVRAQQRLLAVTPYFVPDVNLLAALRLAALRGVRVTLVLPAISNHPLADLARMRALRSLAAVGVDIRLVPQMVHAKAFVVDDSVALSGSVNLDARSLLINYEADFAFYGEQEIVWLTHWIENLAEKGAAFAAKTPNLLRDMMEGLVLALAFPL